MDHLAFFLLDEIFILRHLAVFLLNLLAVSLVFGL